MKKKKLYYGYIVTLLAAMTQFGSTGIVNTSSANLINELINVRGWDATVVSAANSIRALCCLIMPAVGIAIVRFGPRRLIGFTTIITSAALIMTAYVEGPLGFILVYGILVTVTAQFNDQLACSACVNNWWDKRKGRYSSLVTAAGSAGGVLFPLITAWILANKGWSVTLWAQGLLLLFLTGLPQLIFLKDYPEEVGQTIEEGETSPVKVGVSKGKKKENKDRGRYKSPVSWEAKDALRTLPVWIIFAIWALISFTNATVTYFGITKMVLDGMNAVQGTYIMSALNAVTMVSGFFLGKYVDRFGPKTIFFVIGLSQGIGCIMMNYFQAGGVALMVAFLILFGMPRVMLNANILVAISSYYGPKNFSTIQSVAFGMVSVSASLASVFNGWMLSNCGNLTLAFWLSSFGGFAAAVLALCLKPPKLTDKYRNLINHQKERGITI